MKISFFIVKIILILLLLVFALAGFSCLYYFIDSFENNSKENYMFEAAFIYAASIIGGIILCAVYRIDIEGPGYFGIGYMTLLMKSFMLKIIVFDTDFELIHIVYTIILLGFMVYTGFLTMKGIKILVNELKT